MSKHVFKPENSKINIETNYRGRMKITMKFTKDEAQALTNWMSQVKPQQMDEDTFFKQVFFNGVNSLNQQLAEIAKNSLKDPKVREELKKNGIDVEALEKEQGITEAPVEQPQEPKTE
jgi:hypothetical protein